jgi:hypothetical protein
LLRFRTDITRDPGRSLDAVGERGQEGARQQPADSEFIDLTIGELLAKPGGPD